MRHELRLRLSLRTVIAAISMVGLVVSLLLFFLTFKTGAVAAELPEANFGLADDTSKYVYLSDLALDTTHKSQSGWGSLLFDQVNGGGKITERYEGNVVTFDKGIWAHASSNVYYNLEEVGIQGEYDYLTAYAGLNTTAAASSNGVIFVVYGSTDGVEWDVIYNEALKVTKPGTNADFVKVNIKPYKYLRLQADANGSNGNDHAVWGDARLVKEGYNASAVPAVGDFDAYFAQMGVIDPTTNSEYELALLQRSLIKKVGQYTLTRFVRASETNRQTLEWLYNNLDILRWYLTGGAPMGNNYQNSLDVLARLYEAYQQDLANDTVTEYGTRLGDLAARMMISEALVYSAPVASWIGGGQYSDPVKRYEMFKLLYDEGRLDKKVFESLEIEEMRWVLDTMITDNEVNWLNYYTKKENSSGPYHYIRYTFGYNYSLPQYYSADEYAAWDAKYNLGAYNVEYGVTGKPKLWMVFEQGSVCGGISKTGTNIWNTWGYPASVVGQPGHAAYLYYVQDDNGNGKWGIGNNISGWTRSEKSERLPLGWGSNNWDSYYQVSYVPYAQAALNDMDNYVKAAETLLLADLYQNDYAKLEAVYRKALGYQDINMDVWYALIQLYNNDISKTEADFVKLAQDLAEALTYYPLPMWDLMNLIKPHITSSVGQADFYRAQREALNAAKVATANDTLQYDVAITMANYLLNNNDLSMASFSFDGENANKIVMASRYFTDSTNTTWQYSIDGKQTWSAPISVREWQLTPEEIARVNAEDDIVLCIVGTKCGSAYSYDGSGQIEDDSYVIDVTAQNAPSNLYANDLENRVIGTNNVMEWRFSEDEPWTSYAVAVPDLTGDKTVQVRNGATGTRLASDYGTYAFSTDVVNEKKEYITVDHLSIAGVSTEATSQGGQAANTIDGNYNTRWHSAWNGTDQDKWITIQFDQPVMLTAMEYVPAGGGNGKILDGQILGSEDGESFFEIARISGWANNEVVKTVEFQDLEKPVKYVKIVGSRTSSAGGGSFIAARMFNFYKDGTYVVEEPDQPDPEKPDQPDNPDPEKPDQSNPEQPGGNEDKPGTVNPGKPGDTGQTGGGTGSTGESGENQNGTGTGNEGVSGDDTESGSSVVPQKPMSGNSGQTQNGMEQDKAELPHTGPKFQAWWLIAGGGVVLVLLAGGLAWNNRRR